MKRKSNYNGFYFHNRRLLPLLWILYNFVNMKEKRNFISRNAAKSLSPLLYLQEKLILIIEENFNL